MDDAEELALLREEAARAASQTAHENFGRL
jgi:hypothetical protein